MPAGWSYPWRCLWRGLRHITRSTPRRRMILQSLHLTFTDALTFMVLLSIRGHAGPLRPRRIHAPAAYLYRYVIRPRFKS